MKAAGKRQGGFISIIIAIVVIVLILTFLKVDLRGLLESDTGKHNFAYVWELVTRFGHWLWLKIVFYGHQLATQFHNLTK